MAIQSIPERHWRCRGCAALLGVHRGGELHIKYKELELRVAATERVATTCRRCKRVNETATAKAAA